MKIKTPTVDELGTLSLVDGSFVPDNTKAATQLGAVVVSNDPVAVGETVEASVETASGGGVRLMLKTTGRLPGIDVAATSQGNENIVFGKVEPLPIHLVIALTKSQKDTLASAGGLLLAGRELLAVQIAKQICDIVAVAFAGGGAFLPAQSATTLTSQMLDTMAPLKRAVMGLQPMDAFNGKYGGAA